MKIYLVHPISGLSYDQVYEYYKNKIKMCTDAGFQVLHPMTGKGILRTEMSFNAEGYAHPLSSNHAIFERDKWMVQTSDVVYANFIGSKFASIGSIMELALAQHFGKHTVVVMEKGLKMLSPMDRVWLAAIVDGEGCVFIQKRGNSPSDRNKNPSFQPRLSIQMNCKEIMDKIIKITGLGNLCKCEAKERRKEHYVWKVVGQECATVLREIYPYLIEKKAMAASAIHIAESNSIRQTKPKPGQQGFQLRTEEDTQVLEKHYDIWKKAMKRESVEFEDPKIVFENIHRHAFVLEAADIIFETEQEGDEYICKLARGEF